MHETTLDLLGHPEAFQEEHHPAKGVQRAEPAGVEILAEAPWAAVSTIKHTDWMYGVWAKETTAEAARLTHRTVKGNQLLSFQVTGTK